ncbi:nucleotidyltransferase family protein [Pelistega sp. MC2]|uniref:nucleotidyltransferase family protein n=1 Tax=Pelistega sp. MC2 TaxID=1720297 RepID=UPI0008D9D663|nr:nucleotidyltransferase domain-containing protein [Pelistega sp. MC2]
MKPSEILKNHRNDIKRIILANNGLSPRIFGSVARGEDTEDSDLDIIIIYPTPHLSYLDIGTMMYELQEQFGLKVDIATPRGLPEKFRQKVLEMPVEL